MLPRCALGAFPSTLPLRHPRIYPSLSPTTAFRIRAYASGSKPPRPPPPGSSKGAPRPPRPQAFPGSSDQARQTSPGTSIPQDQTWKPKDSIKLEGFAAAAASPGARSKVASSPVEGERPSDRTARRESPLEGGTTSQEPIAQRFDKDSPEPASLREEAQEKTSASENTTAAPEAPTPPLPDLRQGIPSTFDIEFGSRKESFQQEQFEDSSQEDKLHLTSSPSENPRQRDREDRDYDRSAYETSLDRRRAQLANYLFASLIFGSLTGAFYLARPFSTSDEVPSGLDPDSADGWAPAKLYARVRARLGNQVGYYTEPTFPKLLPEVPESQRPPFTLVLSLEDLMIHNTWDTKHGYRTAKRPGIDYFVRYLSQYYELVLFTSVPIAMADPIMKKLDPFHFIMWPLGREATKYEKGEYVKDLSYLNRPLDKTIIIDTHAPHVRNQPENAIILPKWSGDPKDDHTKDLVALIPFLEYLATMGIDDIRPVLKSFEGKHIPEEFARREAEARKKFVEQLNAERTRRPHFSLGNIATSLGVKGDRSMGGGMVLADGQTVAEGLAQGKMLSDQIREQGQKQYENIEKQIREHGAQWLKEEEEEQKRLMDAQMKDMKKGALSWFGNNKEN